MKLSKNILNAAILATTFLSVPSMVRAESAVPEPGAFFATTPEFDPNAAGTKYSGTLSIAYVFTSDTTLCLPPAEPEGNGIRISNMFVVISLARGNSIVPFNTDFRANTDPNPLIGKPATPSFCFLHEDLQTRFVIDMIRTRIVPSIYKPCIPRPPEPVNPATLPDGSCPEFKIKTVSNMQSSGHGSLRADITIAVKD